MIKNRSGVAAQLITVIVLAGVILLLMTLFWAWGIFGAPVAQVVTDVGNQFITATNNNTANNLTLAAQAAATPAIRIANSFEFVGYAMFLLSMLAFIIITFNVRSHPYLAFVWIFFMILIVFVSIIMANTYVGIADSNAGIAASYAGWSVNDFLLRNLPIIMSVFTVISGIIMFMLVSRDQQAEVNTL